MRQRLLPIIVALIGVSGVLPNRYAGASERVNFERQIAPVFVKHCVQCHSGNEPAGGLALNRKEAALRTGESGNPAIVRRHPEQSHLLARLEAGEMPPSGKGLAVSTADIRTIRQWIAEGAKWPRGRVLSTFDFTTDRRAGKDWWSLSPIRRPAPPVGHDSDWTRASIDARVVERLERAGLSPSAEADRVTLLRRATLDLLGLPPTPEEVATFLADESPTAWERQVDRLLASPRYGERWGRHWLDVVGFGETDGFEVNTPRSNAWPYRDYVIRAFNEDKPYDRFLLEQLAGDTVSADVATGFLVAAGALLPGQTGRDEESKRKAREEELATMIQATGTAFLGLSVTCARCHDHKFDCITQRDYTALRASFAGVRFGERTIPAADYPQRLEREPRVRAALRQVDQQLQRLEQALLAKEPLANPRATPGAKPGRAPVHAKKNVERLTAARVKAVRFVVLETNRYEPCIDELEVFEAGSGQNLALAALGAKARSSSPFADAGSALHRLEHIHDGKYGNSRSWIPGEIQNAWVEIELPKVATIDRIEWARDREGKFGDRLATSYRILTRDEAGKWNVVATSLDRRPFRPDAAEPEGPSVELLPAKDRMELTRLRAERSRLVDLLPESGRKPVFAGVFNERPESSRRLWRGDPSQPREEVAPGSIEAIGKPVALSPGASDQERRLALARWLTEDNPLTARVIVNRVWYHHFGRALTPSPADLGWHGGRPGHPELLDQLAAELIASGWRLKPLHRRILLSTTFRQSSQPNDRALAVDKNNVLLWRFAPRRLEAEAIRDSVLAVAGNLRLDMGGPGYSAFKPNDNYVRVYLPKEEFGPPEWRRMVYQTVVRMRQDGAFGLFDCPDAGGVAPKRNKTTTALQALNLLNSPFTVQQSVLFASRLERESGADPARQIERAFQLALGRSPSVSEKQAAQATAQVAGMSGVCRALYSASEFLYIP